MKTPRIAVVGSNMIDLTTNINTMPKAGETVEAYSFDMGFGGKGANQAVAAAKLGAEVTMVCKVGDDIFGRQVIDNFVGLGIDTTYVTVADSVSNGVAPIFVDTSGQNRILIVKGANNHLKPEDVEKAKDKLLSSDLVLLQLEIPLETVYYCIEFGYRNSVPVLLNPAPGTKLDFSIAKKASFLVPNETELEIITGHELLDFDSVVSATHKLVKQGAGTVIVTLGDNGALLVTNEKQEHFPAVKAQAKDTTGAGDAFIGSLAFYFVQTGSLTEAIPLANRYAAYSTERIGTQKAFYTYQEFVARNERGRQHG